MVAERVIIARDAHVAVIPLAQTTVRICRTSPVPGAGSEHTVGESQAAHALPASDHRCTPGSGQGGVMLARLMSVPRRARHCRTCTARRCCPAARAYGSAR